MHTELGQTGLNWPQKTKARSDVILNALTWDGKSQCHFLQLKVVKSRSNVIPLSYASNMAEYYVTLIATGYILPHLGKYLPQCFEIKTYQ